MNVIQIYMDLLTTPQINATLLLILHSVLSWTFYALKSSLSALQGDLGDDMFDKIANMVEDLWLCQLLMQMCHPILFYQSILFYYVIELIINKRN